MNKKVVVGTIIVIAITVIITYSIIYKNTSTSLESTEEYITTSELGEICGFEKVVQICGDSIPCEGKVVNIKGYSIGQFAFPRIAAGVGSGEVYSKEITLAEFTGDFPEGYSEFSDLTRNYFHAKVKVIDIESGEEAEQFKQNIENIQGVDQEKARSTGVEVYVKNAIIVVRDTSPENDCTNFVGLEAKKSDFTFSMP